MLIDPQGRRAGAPALVGAAAAIPRASYLADTGPDDDVSGEPAADVGQEIEVMGPAPGDYLLEIAGRAEGRYRVELCAFDQRPSRDVRAAVTGVPIAPGEHHRYRLSYRSEPALALHGEWLGGGEPSPDDDARVSFAWPLAGRVRLAPGARSAALVVAYDARLVVGGLRALLDGADVTRHFQPAPGRVEAVTLPLHAGGNVLELRAEGRDGARSLGERDEIVFDVP